MDWTHLDMLSSRDNMNSDKYVSLDTLLDLDGEIFPMESLGQVLSSQNQKLLRLIRDQHPASLVEVELLYRFQNKKKEARNSLKNAKSRISRQISQVEKTTGKRWCFLNIRIKG